MRIRTIVIFFIIKSALGFSQNSCCKISKSIEQFAQLTSDEQFITSHLEPIPFTLENPIGKDINFKTEDGKEGHAYEIKAKNNSNKYIFVIHEWWGLNAYIKQESEKLWNSFGNVNVIALDLYDNKVATTRDSASKYMQAVKTERAEAIIKGLLAYIGPKAEIATIGWCFGGGWSLQTSILAGKQSKACIMYYGMPEEKKEKLKSLEAPVMFVWPEQDKWINKGVVSNFESNMKTINKKLTVHPYNADHAFANPSNPKFNKEFAENAFTKSTAFIKEYMK